MSEKLIFGIDGGGTKTVAWIARVDAAEHVLGRGVAGPANPQSVGTETAIAHLEQAIDASFADANISRRPFAAACLGLAGTGREADRKLIEHWAAEAELADRLQVVNDAIPILFCANPDGCGIALISGTGSFAFGRREDGATARAGGWGYLFDDEGSAYAIAVDGLRAIAKSADGRIPPTSLAEPFIAALGVSRVEDLVSAIYDPAMTRSRIAALCPLVFELQEAGDQVATQIVDSAATSLAELVVAVASRLDLTIRAVPLAVTGGVLLHSPYLSNRLQSVIGDAGLGISPVTMVSDPVAGALSIAHLTAVGKIRQNLSPPI